MKSGGWVNRIHRWFRSGKSYQRIEPVEQESRRTVRIVETVQREEKTFLIGTLDAGAFKTCPLCGQKLDISEDNSARPRLPE
jgi:hypothetical protein